MRTFHCLLPVLVLVGACSCSEGGDAGPGEACASSDDCMSGLACAGGVCVDGVGDACMADTDCNAGLVCTASGRCGAPETPIGDAGPRPDVPTGCGEFEFAVRPGAPPDIVLVVDRSLSMDEDIPGGGSKWDALLTAVDNVTHALESVVHFGMASYPSGSGTCGTGRVHIDPDLDTADAIVDRLRSDGTGGATPTAPTLDAVRSYLAMPRTGHDGDPRAVILATDGAPNCNDSLDGSSCTCTVGGGGGGGDCGGGSFCLDDTRTYAAIDASSADGIPVYVVGLPGTEAYADILSEMARRGGTARAGDPAYYAAGDGAELETALTSIAEGLVTCTFEMEVAPENPRRVQILIDGMDVPHTDTMTDGWDYTDASNTTIEIHGTWCDLLGDGGAHTVTAVYACEDLF